MASKIIDVTDNNTGLVYKTQGKSIQKISYLGYNLLSFFCKETLLPYAVVGYKKNVRFF